MLTTKPSRWPLAAFVTLTAFSSVACSSAEPGLRESSGPIGQSVPGPAMSPSGGGLPAACLSAASVSESLGIDVILEDEDFDDDLLMCTYTRSDPFFVVNLTWGGSPEPPDEEYLKEMTLRADLAPDIYQYASDNSCLLSEIDPVRVAAVQVIEAASGDLCSIAEQALQLID